MMLVNLIDRSNPAFFTTVIANAWEGPQSEWQSGPKEWAMATWQDPEDAEAYQRRLIKGLREMEGKP